MYYLGIDAGGTKCRARLTNHVGQILGTGEAGSSNLAGGCKQVFKALQSAYQQALNAAGISEKQWSDIHAGIGVAGFSRKEMRAALECCTFPFCTTQIVSDGHIARLGAHGGADGGVVILGTGSIAIGRVEGQDIRIGGYGFPISDEGSGAYIGLQAVRKTLRASDGRIEQTELTRSMLSQFDNKIHAVIGWMDQARAKDYAKLAPKVVNAADHGDVHGRDILKHAAHHVELMIRGLFARGVNKCALLGGISEPLIPWLSPDVREQLVAPQGDALDGALYLAQAKHQ